MPGGTVMTPTPYRAKDLLHLSGVALNIKSLYTFLCRNYQEGDNIFLFGFSRGAFTVRVLAGLILRCGVVSATSEEELAQRPQ